MGTAFRLLLEFSSTLTREQSDGDVLSRVLVEICTTPSPESKIFLMRVMPTFPRVLDELWLLLYEKCVSVDDIIRLGYKYRWFLRLDHLSAGSHRCHIIAMARQRL